jgi:hypothetical protein
MDILDNISWKELGHRDLSKDIRKLTSKNETERDEGYDIFDRYYLRAVSKLTPYLIPYLIELLDNPEIEEKDRVIAVLMDWSLESLAALRHDEYKDEAHKLLLDIKHGLTIYQDIASNHEDEETRISARQLLNILNRERKFR